MSRARRDRDREDFGWDDERFLSFLPLSHAYEHTGGHFCRSGWAREIFYSEGLEKLASNIEEVRPTIMVVVPRLFEVLRTRIMKQIEKQGRLAELPDGPRAGELASGKAGGRRRAARPADETCCWKARCGPRSAPTFGGRIKAMVSGGAPLNPEVGIFFDAMGLTMLQGYGQTEAGPGHQLQPPERRASRWTRSARRCAG